MRVTLTVTAGPHAGRVFEFHEHDTFIVGRSKQAHFRLPLKDKFFSRNHFLVEVNPPRCRITDMASTNGTHVNGHRVTTAELNDGDVITGGQTTLKVELVHDGPSDSTTVDLSPVAEPSVRSIPKYRIVRELGRGGMGVVHLAHRDGWDEPVALKTIIPAVAAGDQATARFLREAGILRQLDHPHIVAFREIGHAGGLIYFAMDYVPGADAEALMKQHGGPLPIGRAVDLVCQALEGLVYAHGLDFVHRDIKPKNLLVAQVRGRDHVKLADFGLARTYQASALSGLSLSGQFSGSLGFMPPEQITDFRRSRPPVDQYGAGATLYYLLTGRRIYDFPPSFERQMLMILQEEPVPITARREDIPPRLAALIHRSLAHDPGDRFPDARAMLAALERFRLR